MNKLLFLSCLAMAVLCPPGASAQAAADVDVGQCVEQLNATCPIDYKGGWGIGSFTAVGDRYVLVDVQLPPNLAMFLSSLSGDKDSVKQLWIRQLSQFDGQWRQFVDTMVDARRRIILNLSPEGSDESALITLLPSDFKRE